MNKRILFLSYVDLFKHGGGAQATLSYLEAVLELYGRQNVDVIVPEEVTIVEKYQDICFIKVEHSSKPKIFKQLISGYASRFTGFLINYVRKNHDKYSLCILNGGVSAGVAVSSINKLGIKTAVIHHNYEVEYHMDNKSIYTFGGRIKYLIAQAESRAYKNANINLFLTNQDIELFLKAYGNPKGSNGLIGCFQTKEALSPALVTEKVYDISISGSMCAYQTVDGLTKYFNYLHSTSEKLIPNLKTLLTGREPNSTVLDIQANTQGVHIVANPENIFEVVQKGKIFLCPTCIGGGLKLRVMDGLKCGMPILVHRVSARGYDFFVNKDYFKVYDDEKSFEKGLASVLEYINSNVDYSREIQQDYQSYFGFEAGKERMRQCLSSL